MSESEYVLVDGPDVAEIAAALREIFGTESEESGIETQLFLDKDAWVSIERDGWKPFDEDR